MRKIHFLLFLFPLLMLMSCDSYVLYRTVTVTIPHHRWDDLGRLWYEVRYNDFDGVKSFYIGQERTFDLKVPLGRTVYICAYPLGEELALGCAVSPLDEEREFVMDENKGYLCSLLLNSSSDLRASESVNTQRLFELASVFCDDFRCLDDELLLKGVLNGNLSASSFSLREKTEVPPFDCPGGLWVSQSSFDSSFYAVSNRSPTMFLNTGVSRFLNPALGLELRVVVDRNGSVFVYQGPSLLVLLDEKV